MTAGSSLGERARELFPEVPWRRYVAIGDSITEGIGDPVPGYPDGGWAPAVAEALRAVRPELEFTNLGKRSLTTREVRETQVARAIELEPDLITFTAGGNDLLKQRFDPAISERELDAMIVSLRETGATLMTLTMYDIFVSGVTPPEVTEVLSPRFDALCEVIRTVAARHGVHLVDFAGNPVSHDPGIYSSDLQHANMRGHAIAAELMLEGLGELAAALSRSG
jgi:lysophospholipase L1-like esterase